MASILEVIMSISLPPDNTLKPGYTLKIIRQSMKRCWVSSAQILFHSSGVTPGPGCSRKLPHWFSMKLGLRASPLKWRTVLPES